MHKFKVRDPKTGKIGYISFTDTNQNRRQDCGRYRFPTLVAILRSGLELVGTRQKCYSTSSKR